MSTLARLGGRGGGRLMPLVEIIRAHVFAAERIHPTTRSYRCWAKGKTRTGRLRTMCATIGRLPGATRRRPRSVQLDRSVRIPDEIPQLIVSLTPSRSAQNEGAERRSNLGKSS